MALKNWYDTAFALLLAGIRQAATAAAECAVLYTPGAYQPEAGAFGGNIPAVPVRKSAGQADQCEHYAGHFYAERINALHAARI